MRSSQGCNLSHDISFVESRSWTFVYSLSMVSDLSLLCSTLILFWMVSITKHRTRFLGHNRAYQTCKTGTASTHNVILCSARLKCNYLSSNAKLSSVSLNLSLILIHAAPVFWWKGWNYAFWGFFSVQFQKGKSLWLKKLVCGCANAVLAILSYNMRLQVSVSVHFSYQINMCSITPWACIIAISLLSVLAFSCQTWLCFNWHLG